MDKMTVAELRTILGQTLECLEGYNDNDMVCTAGNTYFMNSNYFIALGRYGFCPLTNIKIAESEDADEDEE